MSQHVEGTERKRSEAKVWVIGVLVAVAVLLAAWLVYRASNAAFSDDEIIDWLLAEEETLGRTPIAALLAGHKSEVRRVARTLA